MCLHHSVRLHAQLNPIKAIVGLCSSIGQLQLSEYTWRCENRFIGRSMSCPGTIGGAVPISTSVSRATGWPLYVTSNNKLRRHSQKMFSVDSCQFTSGPCHFSDAPLFRVLNKPKKFRLVRQHTSPTSLYFDKKDKPSAPPSYCSEHIGFCGSPPII